jgi:hypothetical protein
MREDAEQRLAVLWIDWGRADVERAIFAKVHMGILPGEDTLVGLVILRIQPSCQGMQGGLPVRDPCEGGTLEIGVVMCFPVSFGNQVVIQ